MESAVTKKAFYQGGKTSTPSTTLAFTGVENEKDFILQLLRQSLVQIYKNNSTWYYEYQAQDEKECLCKVVKPLPVTVELIAERILADAGVQKRRDWNEFDPNGGWVKQTVEITFEGNRTSLIRYIKERDFELVPWSRSGGDHSYPNSGMKKRYDTSSPLGEMYITSICYN